MSREKVLFDLMELFVGDDQAVEGIYITDKMDSEIGYRCFTAIGVSFDVTREYVCEPDEVHQYEGVYSDGWVYEFRTELEGFKTISLEDAIKGLKMKADEFI